MQNSFRVPDVTPIFSKSQGVFSTDLLWVKPALPSRDSALTEEVRQEDWREDDFCVGSATAFPRGLGGTPAAMSMLRVVLNLSFRILDLLGGRLLVDQACVARTRLLRWSKKFS